MDDFAAFHPPNRRFPSILDFQELCAQRGIRIAKAIYVDSKTGAEVHEDPNLHADIAVVALSREAVEARLSDIGVHVERAIRTSASKR